MSGEHNILLHEIENLKITLRYAKDEIEDLKEELQFLDDGEGIVNDDHILVDIAKRLGIIVVPNMPQWALLLEMERSIEKMKEK